MRTHGNVRATIPRIVRLGMQRKRVRQVAPEFHARGIRFSSPPPAAIKLEHRHRAATKLEQSLSLPKRTRFSSPPPGCHQTRASTATSGTRCTGWKPGTSAFATTRLQIHRCFSRKSTIASCLVLVLGAVTRKSAVAATLSCTLATCQQQVRLATTLKCNRKSHETSRMGQ